MAPFFQQRRNSLLSSSTLYSNLSVRNVKKNSEHLLKTYWQLTKNFGNQNDKKLCELCQTFEVEGDGLDRVDIGTV